jgi:trehalose 6-phosphate phosphatase
MAHKDASFPWLKADSQTLLCAALAAEPRGLFTDVDGTISPIAPTPDAAVLLPEIAGLLTQAQTTFKIVAAVSGRSAQDAQRLVGVPGLLYIGNHGLERIDPGHSPGNEEAAQVHVAPAALPFINNIHATLKSVAQTLAPRFPGMIIEQKGASGSIHVRQTRDPAVAEAAVAAALQASAAANGLRVTRGKFVVELRPPVEINKGTAISEFIRSAGLRGAFYLGDDHTDIDAFRALRQLTTQGACQGVAVAVLHSEAPAHLAAEADLALDSIEQVPAFLQWLLAHAPTQENGWRSH